MKESKGLMRTILSEQEHRLARAVVLRVAPTEMDLLEEVTSKPHILSKWRNRSVGFGVEIPWDAVSPSVVLLVSWALGVAQGALDDAIKDRVREIADTWRQRRFANALPPAVKSPDEALVRQGLVDYAISLGRAEEEAKQIAEVILLLLPSAK